MSNISLGELPDAPSTFHTHVAKPSPFKTSPILSDYEMQMQLNSGSHGVVWSAIKKDTRENVAVKIMKKNIRHNSRGVIQREIEILASLHHPNILRFIDAYEDSHTFYVVTELCTGGDLFDAITRGLSEQNAKQVIRQLLEALAFCHEKKIAHCDVKPENIVLSEPWDKQKDFPNIKLIDFGLAQYFPQHGYFTNTQGSLDYMAPEVLIGQYDHKADSWAAGVTLFTMLIGFFPPFDGGDATERFKSIARIIRNDKLFSQASRPISGLAEDFIRKMLKLNSIKRPSAAEALEHPWLTGKTKPITPLEISERLRHFIESQRLIRVIKRIIQHQLQPLEKIRIEALFRHFSKQQDKISLPEMANILREKVEIDNVDEIRVILNVMDLNSDGYIDVHEFLFSLFPSN